jgi:hypothetical protein
VVNDNDAIETVTSFTVDEVILGGISRNAQLEIREPGGTFGERSTVIPGVPHFTEGNKYVLFLMRDRATWRVLDLALGQFAYAIDADGNSLLVRDEEEINAAPSNGKPYAEKRRLAAEFLAFLRAEAAQNGTGAENYFTDKKPLLDTTAPPRLQQSKSVRISTAKQTIVPLIAPYTATSYTMTITGGLGARWNVFPSAVNFFSVGTEPGAPGGGVTAINAAFAAWNGDPNSNVNYVYAGADTSGAHTRGISGPDSENTVIFERNLSAYGAGPFTCSGSSYSGTLGIGGVSSTSGTHVGPNNETFATTTEGDVEMNQGVANCTVLFNNGDFNSAVTHEVGHTLGFRHSDQTRASDPNTPCTNDASLECSSAAIMKAIIPTGLNAALQPWDQHAVQAVYPSTTSSSMPAPSGVSAVATSSTSVRVAWNPVSVATSYQIFRRGPGGSYVQIGTSATNSYVDTTAAANTAYLYRVRAVGSGGTDDPLGSGVVVRAVHLAELRTAVNAVRALAGLPAATFTDSATRGVVVKAIHITELRAALDAAMNAIGFTSLAGGYTDTLSSAVKIKAIHFQEIRNRVK